MTGSAPVWEAVIMFFLLTKALIDVAFALRVFLDFLQHLVASVDCNLVHPISSLISTVQNGLVIVVTTKTQHPVLCDVAILTRKAYAILQ